MLERRNGPGPVPKFIQQLDQPVKSSSVQKRIHALVSDVADISGVDFYALNTGLTPKGFVVNAGGE